MQKIYTEVQLRAMPLDELRRILRREHSVTHVGRVVVERANRAAITSRILRIQANALMEAAAARQEQETETEQSQGNVKVERIFRVRLKGLGCDMEEHTIAAMTVDPADHHGNDVLILGDAESLDDSGASSEKFCTTLADLKAFVAALEGSE